ncbi:hypothetical protein [Clostridium autoethanogenum]|uniref:hypothetical protein n=1 Tax=Clostridium autoethanogenum TaxID=84023 RepID=UPI001FA9C2D2|nr:hypothetical protein [Clostridium autoethanogenum]
MNKSVIIKNTKPIKFGNQIGMMIDELDTGSVRSISEKEGTEARKAKGKGSEIQK